MCECKAHVALVDCTCMCDHTNDQLQQQAKYILHLENEKDRLLNELETVEHQRWQWLASTRKLQQEAFGVDYETLVGNELADYVTYNSCALSDELHEFLGEIGWKPWASPRGWVNRENAVGELVDLGHFFANLLNAIGVTDAEWESAYRKKQQINRDRQKNGYDGLNKCPKCKRAYDDPSVTCVKATAYVDAWCSKNDAYPRPLFFPDSQA